MIRRVSTGRNIHFSMSTAGCTFSGVHRRNSEVGPATGNGRDVSPSDWLPLRGRVRRQKHQGLKGHH
jgi:hypothetical protein